jgi:hypothetical protein
VNAAQARRALIAQRSALQAKVDPRPHCQDCGAVLVHSDFYAYWEGREPPAGMAPHITPRCCEDCADRTEQGETP